MDVSNQQNTNEPGESGPALIEQVVSLTGLPESMVEKEIHEILDLTGQNAASLTLDELRQAMLLYLEAIAESHGVDPSADSDAVVLEAAEEFKR